MHALVDFIARRRGLIATVAIGAAALTAPAAEAGPAEDATAAVGAVTTACRVEIDRAVTSFGTSRGRVDPGPSVPFGHGQVQVDLVDGRHLVLIPETLLCRRDGGTVPDHGGANIADFTGHAVMNGDGAAANRLTFQAHVEDRGAGREQDDYLAIRVLDRNGEELWFDANFLTGGDIRTVPVPPRDLLAPSPQP